MPQTHSIPARILIALAASGASMLAALAFAGESSPTPASNPTEPAVPAPEAPKNPTMDRTLNPTGQTVSPDVKLQYATFGAGCFWGVEATFRETPGVIATSVGYSGGKVENPTYKLVCTDTTGHAEVVHIQFDPTKISYEQVLQVFWDNHNPTTLNRQGPDVGSQYRSAIYFHDESQKAAAEKSKKALADSGKWGTKPIVTEISAFSKFYAAEDYHQMYLEKRGLKACH